jgi:hypothetical protein
MVIASDCGPHGRNKKRTRLTGWLTHGGKLKDNEYVY